MAVCHGRDHGAEGGGVMVDSRGMGKIRMSGPSALWASLTRPTVVLVALVVGGVASAGEWGTALPMEIGPAIELPAAETTGGPAMRDAMGTRRSVRVFSEGPVTMQELSQLLWAAQGVTNKQGYRTVPSAGAKFPIEMYVVAERVEGLEPGLYHYRADDHSLGKIREGVLGKELQAATTGQPTVGAAAANFIVMAVVWRVEAKYGPERSERYVVLEGGAVMEHLLLEAVALGLGGVAIGGFGDEDVQTFVGSNAMPVVIVPVGRVAEE